MKVKFKPVKFKLSKKMCINAVDGLKACEVGDECEVSLDIANSYVKLGFGEIVKNVQKAKKSTK